MTDLSVNLQIHTETFTNSTDFFIKSFKENSLVHWDFKNSYWIISDKIKIKALPNEEKDNCCCVEVWFDGLLKGVNLYQFTTLSHTEYIQQIFLALDMHKLLPDVIESHLHSLTTDGLRDLLEDFWIESPEQKSSLYDLDRRDLINCLESLIDTETFYLLCSP